MMSMAVPLIFPVSAEQVKNVMRTIPSWARMLPEMGNDTAFQELGMDSLAFLELVGELQSTSGLEIPDDDIERITTVAGIVRYLNERLQ